MSSEMLTAESEAVATIVSPATPPVRRRSAGASRFTRSLTAHGEPLVWLSGGALALSLTMIVGLLGLIIYQGVITFWPSAVVQLTAADGTKYLGEVGRTEHYRPAPVVLERLPPEQAHKAQQIAAADNGRLHRTLLRTGNYDLTNTHFHWIDDYTIAEESKPEWATVVERLTWGRFYGTPSAFLIDDKEVASDPESVWQKYVEFHATVRSRWAERIKLERYELGHVGNTKNSARLNVKRQELRYGADSAEAEAARGELEKTSQWEDAENARILAQIAELNAQNSRYKLQMVTAGGQTKVLGLDEIVRAYPANQLGASDKLGVYFSRLGEFLWDDPREANSEGGVFPAIFGTVVMTLVMSLAVVPFGVLAALYLREYAKPGPVVSAIRIAINNLAGVPSIVFGVFGLGFFCYVMGASVDQLFFTAELAENDPTFGTGGVLWASLTLALLTLPVVIVTTEEALAAVPSSMREGSYACGASKWQTIQRIVLPRALPGIMTGMILAMARGAGEVAPLMLVGAMKLAPELPVDGVFPFVHAQRSFMHLGFHIFDLGFQSQNSEAAKPMVFTTTLLLIGIIAFLNVTAIWLRGRLRRKFISNHF